MAAASATSTFTELDAVGKDSASTPAAGFALPCADGVLGPKHAKFSDRIAAASTADTLPHLTVDTLPPVHMEELLSDDERTESPASRQLAGEVCQSCGGSSSLTDHSCNLLSALAIDMPHHYTEKGCMMELNAQRSLLEPCNLLSEGPSGQHPQKSSLADTDSREEVLAPPDFVRSVECKKSGSMESLLQHLRFGEATPSSLAVQLRERVCRFAANKVGCQVLELLAPKLGVQELELIASECAGEVRDLSTQRYGARSMRSLFAALIQRPQLQELMHNLVQELLVDFRLIVLDPYASLVFVHLLEHGPPQLRSDLAELLLKPDDVHFVTFCLQEHACRVAAAAIRCCAGSAVIDMAGKVLARGAAILTIRAEGVLVLRALLGNPTVAAQVREQLEPAAARLQRSRRGRKLANDLNIV